MKRLLQLQFHLSAQCFDEFTKESKYWKILWTCSTSRQEPDVILPDTVVTFLAQPSIRNSWSLAVTGSIPTWVRQLTRSQSSVASRIEGRPRWLASHRLKTLKLWVAANANDYFIDHKVAKFCAKKALKATDLFAVTCLSFRYHRQGCIRQLGCIYHLFFFLYHPGCYSCHLRSSKRRRMTRTGGFPVFVPNKCKATRPDHR